MAAVAFKALSLLLWLIYTATNFSAVGVVTAYTWCVVRSEASDQALQTALEYACEAGADCAPIQSSGLCFLPNTLQAHASYAFNSYYQRKGDSPAACSFSGTATFAATDPSYGSCVYPSSPNNAGGIVAPAGIPAGTTTPSTIPTITGPPPPPPGTITTTTTTTAPFYGGGGGLNPGPGSVIPNQPNASPNVSMETMFSCLTLVLVLSFMFRTM